MNRENSLGQTALLVACMENINLSYFDIISNLAHQHASNAWAIDMLSRNAFDLLCINSRLGNSRKISNNEIILSEEKVKIYSSNEKVFKSLWKQ